MRAEEILKMIETVSPDDVAKLYEIDYLTECLVRQTESPFKFLSPDGGYTDLVEPTHWMPLPAPPYGLKIVEG